MTLNTIDDTFFPTHSDTHFLSKYVDNLTQLQIKLSRNKEKQTDNIPNDFNSIDDTSFPLDEFR